MRFGKLRFLSNFCEVRHSRCKCDQSFLSSISRSEEKEDYRRNDRKINEKEIQTEKIVVETALGGKEKERKKVE